MFTHPGRWRQRLAALAAAIGVASGAALAPARPGAAQSLPATDLARMFADCTGRYSALMEYLWVVDGPASVAAARRRDLLADLTEAALPLPDPAWASRAMAWRIEAKAAQRQLLDRATWGRPGPDSSHARSRAEAYIADCDRLLAGL